MLRSLVKIKKTPLLSWHHVWTVATKALLNCSLLIYTLLRYVTLCCPWRRHEYILLVVCYYGGSVTNFWRWHNETNMDCSHRATAKFILFRFMRPRLSNCSSPLAFGVSLRPFGLVKDEGAIFALSGWCGTWTRRYNNSHHSTPR